jgi:predicted dehydrogenase
MKRPASGQPASVRLADTAPERRSGRLRLGVVGVGHLGRIHARLASQLPDCQLVGVADSCAAAREAVAAETKTRPWANFLDLARHIDAAIVATPTRTHLSVALELASRGIHLLVEKPLTATAAEATRLVATCRRYGVTLQVGHVEQYNPALRTARPHLGDPKYIDAVRMSGYPARSTDVGVVLDLMIHDIDLVLDLTRSPVCHVDALGLAVVGGHEDVAQARLVFENGCVVNLTASRVSYIPARTMQVWSAEGFAALDFATRRATIISPDPAITARQLRADKLSEQETARLKDHLFDELLAKHTLVAPECNAIAQEQRDFVAAVQTGNEPPVTGLRGRNAVAVAE